MDHITLEQFLPWIKRLIEALVSSAGDVPGGVGKTVDALDPVALMSLAAALGWAAGVRLYLVVFLVGMAGFTGSLPLPHSLQVVQHPAMLGASGFMLFVEFFADKIPGVDSLWDVVHTVIRVPAGAALAAGALGADNATMSTAAALVGGSLAATAHATKASTRAAVNASPEPFSNVAVSLIEDGLVVFMLWLATNHPAIFALVLAIVLALSALAIVLLWRFLCRVVSRASRFFSTGSHAI